MSNVKIGEIELNLNSFFRYIYGGFILCLSVLLIFRTESLNLYKDLGGKEGLLGSGLLVILSVFAVGTGFHALYKTLISEWIIDNLHLQFPHLFWKHSKDKCAFHYLNMKFNVQPSEMVTAYRLIRDSEGCGFSSDVKGIFYIRHSGIHVLYQTATVFLIASVTIATHNFIKNVQDLTFSYNFLKSVVNLNLLGLAGFAVLFFFFGFLSDKDLCQDECAYLRCLDEGTIRDKLTKARLIPEERSNGEGDQKK
ncbi:MAG: hypothetical protein CV087_05720 [Candidatus Brocadia sp. WS118]|nr:MAG: hypothetical protein CV087_05720 [Candidatus Brocadia sp. WS118]